jgi:hypothetical protein
MGALKTVLRALTGMVSILVSKNHLFEKPGERSFQPPLPESSPTSKKRKQEA